MNERQASSFSNGASEDIATLKNTHLALLKSLQYDSGLFSASSKKVTTGYDKAWLRDNFYVALSLHELGERDDVQKIYHAFSSILLKHEEKIDYAIQVKPEFNFQYVHPRYHPETFDEYWEAWGNKQNDAIGSLLFLLGLLKKAGYPILDSPDEERIVQKLIVYLQSVEYWRDSDSGVWEEGEEIHSSSLGACVAGLKEVKDIGFEVPEEMIERGNDMLHYELLPRESHDKFCDLALLTLMYPFNVVNASEAREILKNIEYHLIKQRGVIRYKGDHYYNKNWDRVSEEAEWTFGFSLLSLAYGQLGEKEKASLYFQKAKDTINEKGEIPELYYSNEGKHNENSPLAWSEAMFLIALTRNEFTDYHS